MKAAGTTAVLMALAVVLLVGLAVLQGPRPEVHPQIAHVGPTDR